MKRLVKEKVESKAQFCLLGTKVEQVLKSINGVDVVGARIRFGMPIKRKKIKVSAKLRELGVKRLSQTMLTSEAEIVYDERISPSAIRKNVRAIANELDLFYSDASFRTLTVEKDGNVAKFISTTKELLPEGTTDMRRKLKVLGLVSGRGKVNTLVASLGAKKLICEFENVKVKQIALCKMA